MRTCVLRLGDQDARWGSRNGGDWTGRKRLGPLARLRSGASMWMDEQPGRREAGVGGTDRRGWAGTGSGDGTVAIL